eukprot:COSAG01_NODE_9302_length_2489_cov_6.794142_1_plen_525_part_10
MSGGSATSQDPQWRRLPGGGDREGLEEPGEQTRFPRASVAALSLGLFANSVSIMMLFPFLPFMITDLGMVSDPREPGLYSGYIGGAFMAGRIFTSFLWGRFSDTHGRKPVIVWALISVAFFAVAFGLSMNYGWALASRFLAGATNGILGTAKTMVSEICLPSQQATCMAITTATWAFGTIAGSALGGLLARPAIEFPSVFAADGIFGTFPYLLPCLACAGFAVVALALSLVWLRETLPLALARSWRANYLCGCCGGSQVQRQYAVVAIDDDMQDDLDGGKGDRDSDGLGSELAVRRGCCCAAGGSEISERPAVMSISCYVLLSFVVQAEFDTFPLWTAAPQSAGGLGLESAETGALLSIMGAVQLVYSLGVFPKCHKRLGTLRSLRMHAMLMVPLYLLLPLASTLAPLPSGPPANAVDTVPQADVPPRTVDDELSASLPFYFVAIVRSTIICLVSGCFTCCAMSMNNSVSITERGTLNGVGMTAASIGKALGPALASPLFAWSLINRLNWPFDYSFLYTLFSFSA